MLDLHFWFLCNTYPKPIDIFYKSWHVTWQNHSYICSKQPCNRYSKRGEMMCDSSLLCYNHTSIALMYLKILERLGTRQFCREVPTSKQHSCYQRTHRRTMWVCSHTLSLELCPATRKEAHQRTCRQDMNKQLSKDTLQHS